ncbi:MAG: ADOP family duplicated permease [Longimicrobiales bacterium]
MGDRARAILLRLRALVRRGAVDEELDDEVRFHIEREIERRVAAGASEAQARREALVAFGGVDRYTEEARDTRGLGWIDDLRQDLRVSARLLVKNPLFTTAAVLTLALGIGANTAIFSVVDAVLLRASPFPQPERLIMLWETDRDSDTSHEPASWPDIVDFRERSRTLSGIGALIGMEATLTGTGEPERLSAVGVTPNLLGGVLGVRPVLGRFFAQDEGDLQGTAVAVLSAGYWQGRFNADPAVLGSTLTVNGRPTTVVGVAPASADLGIQQVHARADYSATYAGGRVDMWVAVRPTADAFPRSTHPFLTVARLEPGASAAAAQQELAAIALDLEQAYPVNAARGVNLEPYADVVFGAARPALLVLLGAVALVLLVTCANVANLLLARAAVRTREVAVRRALGARSGRISRQFLVESAVLTALGAAAGLLLARWGLQVLLALAPADIPRLTEARLDARVLGFTAAVAALVSLAFGLIPVLQSRRLDLQGVLKAQPGRNVSEGRTGRRFRAGVVVAEIALAVALVIGAGLLLRSFWSLSSVDPGFATARVLKLEYQLPESRYPIDFSRYPEAPEIHGFQAELLRRVSALPGVEQATLAAVHPLDAGFTNSFSITGREAESAAFPEIRVRFITPGYLQVLEVPLLAGRDLTAGDDAAAPAVGLLNRAAAERYFAGMEPIGQEISFWGIPRRVVGVIGDERFQGLDAEVEPAIYSALAQAPQRRGTLLVRATVEPTSLVPSIRRVFSELDPQLALYGVEPLATTVAESVARPRFTALLLAVFAGIAILLALIGVHGVLSYTVAQRSAEVGIRVALGASHSSVLRLVVGEGLRLAALGVAIGLIAAFAGSRLLASLLFGVTATDPLTFVAVAALVLATAALASWLPARRATRADPMAALRAE